MSADEACTVMGDVLGDERHGFVVVLDGHETDADLACLGWRTFTVTPAATTEVIGEAEKGTPRRRRAEIELGERVSVLQAIDGYAEILLERYRRTADEVNAVSRAEGAASDEALRRKPRGSEGFTVDEARERAAEEMVRTSIEALFALPGGRYAHVRRGISRRFSAEIEEAAACY